MMSFKRGKLFGRWWHYNRLRKFWTWNEGKNPINLAGGNWGAGGWGFRIYIGCKWIGGSLLLTTTQVDVGLRFYPFWYRVNEETNAL